MTSPAGLPEPAKLLPQHQKLIDGSGITPEVAAARGYRSVTSRKELAGLGFPEYQQLAPALLIPVRDVTGATATYQIRPDKPRTKKNKAGVPKVLKYETRAGALMTLDVPPTVRHLLADPSAPLYITEGARKADSAASRGQCCISLLGVWNWRGTNGSGGKVALADWESVALNGRTVYVAFDSDAMLKPEVELALDRLVPFLRKHDANVTALYLPGGVGPDKVGLDDYLAAGHSFEDLAALTKPAEAKPAVLLNGPVPVSSAAGSGGDESALPILQNAGSVRRLHPAQDVVDGVLWYGSQVDGENLVLVNSERLLCRPESLPAGFKLRHDQPGRSRCVTHEVMQAWLRDGHGSVAHALDDLEKYFSSHMVLPRPGIDGLWLAAWSLVTYCYRAFPVCPYVAVSSAAKRCGKTTLLKHMSRTAFNAGPVEVASSKTESSVFRQAEESAGIQFFDEADKLSGAKDEHSGNIIAVLNAGYERGSTVTRMEKNEKGKFAPTHHEVYAPRVIAGLRGLADTLDDRSIKLTLKRRKEGETFDDSVPGFEDAAELRHACVLACLASIGKISGAYAQAKALLRDAKLDDRAVMLWAPLAAVVAVADDEDGGERLARLMEAAQGHAAVRDAAEEDSGPVVAQLRTLGDLCGEGDAFLAPGELAAAVSGKPGFEWVKNTKNLAKVMNPLGFFSTQTRLDGPERQKRGKERARGYEITRAALADLSERFGGADKT